MRRNMVLLTGLTLFLVLVPKKGLAIDPSAFKVQQAVPTVSVLSAEPTSVRLAPGGKTAAVTLRGEGLEGALAVKAFKGKNPVRTVTGSPGKKTTDGGRVLLVGALPQAEPGEYNLRLVAGGKEIPVPLKVTVAKPLAKAGRSPALPAKELKSAVEAPAPSPVEEGAGKGTAKPPPDVKAQFRKPLPVKPKPEAEDGISPGDLSPLAQRVEIVSEGGGKKPPQPGSQTTSPSASPGFGSAVGQLKGVDFRCSIRSSYDREGTKPIEAKGADHGVWHNSQKLGTVVWTHVDVTSINLSSAAERGAGVPVRLETVFWWKTYGGTWKSNPRTYTFALKPGESYWRRYYTPTYYLLQSKSPLITRVTIRPAMEDYEGNNSCEYKVEFQSP